MSTITVPNPVPDTNEDCITLHKALEDFGCDKEALLNVICHRDQQQRQRIRHSYNRKYEEDILKTLKSKLHAKLEKGAVLWMCDPAERDATILHEALRCMSKDYSALTEVLYLRTSAELLDIRRAYSSRFGRSLEEELATKIDGSEKKLLLGLLREARSEDDEIDTLQVDADTKDLLSAISNTKEVNKSVIIRVFTTRSSSHLRDVLDSFKTVHGYSFGKILKSKTHGGFRVSVRVVMHCAKNLINYYAKTLYESMKGMGTDDSTLTRIIVTCAELNMKDIKAHFSRKYQRPLHEMISLDTMGHFQTFLMLLVGVSRHEIHSGSFVKRLSSWSAS